MFKKDLKILAFIYCALAAVFFAVSFMADRLPRPYHKRVIPAEITP